MRKIWMIFITVFIILALMIPGVVAEGVPITLIGEPQDGYAQEIMDSVCVMGDTLYLKGRNVYQWKPGDTELTLFYKIYPPLEELQISREIPMFHGLVNFGGTLMTLDIQKGVLCEVRETGLVPTEHKVDVVSFPNSTGDLDFDSDRVVYMFESEGRLFIVGRRSEMDHDINLLYEVNTKTGQITALTDESESIISAMPYKTGQLLIAASSTPHIGGMSGEDGYVRLCLWDMGKNTYTEDSYIPIKDGQVQTVNYDAKRDIIYITAGSQIYKTAWNSAPEIVNYLDREYYEEIQGAPQLIGDSIAICSPDGARIYSVAPTKTPKRVLTVMNDANYWFDKPAKFAAQYPHITVKPIEMNSTINLDTVPTLIASGEAPDIFVFTGRSSLDAFLDKGYAMDLSDDAELMELVDQLYPQLQEFVLRDGKLIGYPSGILPNLWVYDTGAFEELGLGRFPETFEELLNLFVLWENEYADEHRDKMLMHFYSNAKNELFNMALDQYVALNEREDTPLRFDTPEFRTLIQIFDAFPLKYATPEEEANDLDYDNYAAPLIEACTNLIFLPSSHMLTFQPRLSKDSPPVATADVELYIVNPDTKNRDIALQYIKFMVQETQSDQRYMMTPSLHEPVESEQYKQELEKVQKQYESEKKLKVDSSKQRGQDAFVAQLEHYINVEMESRRWEVRAEHLEQYRALAPSIQVWNSSVLYNLDVAGEMRQIISRYQQGQLSLDQMVRELDQKAAMIYFENQ